MKDILDYEKFKEKFVSELYEYVPDGVKLFVNTDGVNESVIYDDGSGNAIKPSYKLKTAYKMYESGYELERMALSIANELYKGVYSANYNLIEKQYKNLSNKEYMLANAVIQIADKNYKKEISEAPHINIPGTHLCAIFRVIADRKNGQILSFVVTKKLMENAGLTVKDMYMAAMKNLLDDGFAIEIINERKDMYKISTNSEMYGASVLMFSDILDQLADKMEGDYFMLPLSVHELIIIPAAIDNNPYMFAKILKTIVMDVNESVNENDILSESVFIYKEKEKRIIEIA